MLHFFYRTVVLFIKYLLSYCFTFIRIHLDTERNFSAMQLSSQTLSLSEKLNLLADAAKYDVACTSSGVNRAGKQGHLGNSVSCGICHSFSSDGRCISLLKFCRATTVSTTVNTASTAPGMTGSAPRLHRRRSVHSSRNFIAETILRDSF